ncbi:MAG: hypothetical protein JXP48_06475 [Acidobacteria bacterium]|nr:hypothetical protein [Acidobacteriota bacterium]
MNCRTFHRNLEDYLEGGLDFPGRFGMERHAGECIRCGKALADARRLGRMAAGLARVRAPEGFEAAVCGKIAARKSRWFLTRLRGIGTYGFGLPSPGTLALAASGVLALGLGAFYAFHPSPGPGSRAAVTAEQAGPEAPGADAVRVEQARAEPVQAQATQVEAVRIATVPVVERKLPAAPPEREAAREPVAESVAPPPDLAVAVPVDVAASPRTLQVRFPRERQYNGMEVVDYLLVGPESHALPDRLPRKLYVKYGQASEEYFIRNVSH